MRRRGMSFNAERSITKEQRVATRKFRLREAGENENARSRLLSIMDGTFIVVENDVDPLWISITIENRGAINSGLDHLACRIHSQRDAIMAACPRRL